MYRVTTIIRNVEFHRDCKGLVETFEAVKALIESNKLMFPEQERTLEEYYKVIARMAPGTEGRCTSHDNHIFRIEVIEKETEE